MMRHPFIVERELREQIAERMVESERRFLLESARHERRGPSGHIAALHRVLAAGAIGALILSGCAPSPPTAPTLDSGERG